MNTSLSRQFSLSWTWRQPLLNRMIEAGLNGTPKFEQMLWARSGCALPVKTTISRIGGEASLGRKYRVLRMDYAATNDRTPQQFIACGADLRRRRIVGSQFPLTPTSSTLSGETVA